MTEEELQDLSRAAASKLERCADSHGGPELLVFPSGELVAADKLAFDTEACAEIAVRILAAEYLHYEVCGIDDRAGCYYWDASADGIGSFDASETEDQGDLIMTWRVSTLRALVAL